VGFLVALLRPSGIVPKIRLRTLPATFLPIHCPLIVLSFYDITHQKLAKLRFEVLKHTAYSPDLAPSDYHLFPNLKKHLKGKKLFEH
jgi:hypothetical protein